MKNVIFLETRKVISISILPSRTNMMSIANFYGVDFSTSQLIIKELLDVVKKICLKKNNCDMAFQHNGGKNQTRL